MKSFKYPHKRKTTCNENNLMSNEKRTGKKSKINFTLGTFNLLLRMFTRELFGSGTQMITNDIPQYLCTTRTIGGLGG